MKKQGPRGTGTIYREESGRWHGQMTLPNGKRKSVYGKRQREVQRKMAEIRREIEAGMHTSLSGDQSLRTYIEDYLAVRKEILEPKTYTGYHSLAKVHLGAGTVGDKALQKITPQDIHDLYADRLKSGLSSTRVHHLHAMLRVVLQSAVKLGIIPRNPCDFVDAPPIKTREIAPLNQQQVAALRAVLRGHREESFFLTILGTGVRLAEALGLRWDEVDLDARKLRVRTTQHRDEGNYSIRKTKSKSSRREIPLTVQLVEVLKQQRAWQTAQREAIGAAWDDSWGLVFTTGAGTPLSPDHARWEFRKIKKQAGLPFITRIHDLRHTFATLLLERGVNIRVVSELLGHSSVAITLAIYGHVTPKMQDTALEHITAMLEDGNGEIP